MTAHCPDDHGILNAGNDVHGRTNAVGAGCAGTATLAAAPQTRVFHVNVELPRRPVLAGE